MNKCHFPGTVKAMILLCFCSMVLAAPYLPFIHGSGPQKFGCKNFSKHIEELFGRPKWCSIGLYHHRLLYLVKSWRYTLGLPVLPVVCKWISNDSQTSITCEQMIEIQISHNKYQFWIGMASLEKTMRFSSEFTVMAIGRLHLPPYWSLGFHLSRWGYHSIDVLKNTVEHLKKYDIPHDVQYGDVDYMERQMDFTYDKTNFVGLPEYIDQLKKDGIHYVIALDPFLTKDELRGTYRPFELGEERGIWINNSDGVTPAVGKDMNEPANFGRGQQPGCTKNSLNNPPYVPYITGGVLAEKTLCPDSKTYLGNFYDTHSLFGWSQTVPTFYACQNATKKRAFVLSRSAFVGSGGYTGHWLGDNFSHWRDMHMSIIGMLEFNLFGIPYEQDPGVFGEQFAAISHSVLKIRYSLLPYLYTLFYSSHVGGNTVVRGLMHEFTSDPQTHGIDRAFLWGPALMIAPVLQEVFIMNDWEDDNEASQVEEEKHLNS